MRYRYIVILILLAVVMVAGCVAVKPPTVVLGLCLVAWLGGWTFPLAMWDIERIRAAKP